MRILFLCHNHPALQPGGTEVMAHGLFRELREKHGVQGLFLAAVTGAHRERRPGTMLQAASGGAPDELLVWLGHFDRFMLSQPDTYGLASLAPLIGELDPDVVHVHHPLLFGLETIDLIRRLAPRARMVFTAHDFFPLCAQEGQLLTTDGRLCPGPSLDRCQRCFPGRTGTDFQLRELGVRDAFAAFDLMLTPSAFARDRYLAAGWPAERFAVVPNGLPALPAGTAPAPHRVLPPGGPARRDRIGFFGHVNRYKGGLVLLQASRHLTEQGVPHRVALHGGTAYQTDAFLEEVQAAIAAAPAARLKGPYLPADQAALMAEVDWVVVPSVWWENAPLVVLEAFRHRRPVICGGVGGMAEMVRDGVDGLHAPVNDPGGLAQVLREAIETEGLWERLVAGIRPPPTMSEVATLHMQHYQRAMADMAA